MRCVVLAVGIVALFDCTARGENWPQFRGAAGDGQAANGSQLPEEWSAEKNLAWKAAIPGYGWSQPVVWGEKVFVTTAVAEKQARPEESDWSPGGSGLFGNLLGIKPKPPDAVYQWKVYCLDQGTGKILWEQVAKEGKPTTTIHARNSYATETPATDGERVIVSFGAAGLYCYDLAGKLLWSKDLGGPPIQMGWGTGSSPVIEGERVFVQCDNHQKSFLVALDKKTGEELWRAARDEQSNWCTPVVWKNKTRTELVVGGGGKMRSYDPAKGEVLWEMAGSGRAASSPLATAELVFVDSADRLTGNRGIVAAIRPGASGDISLAAGAEKNDFVAWSTEVTGYRVASPLVLAKCLYIVEQRSGVVRCLDAETGKEHYRKRVPGAEAFTASPWAAGGKVFCLDQKGQTFVLEAGPEFKVVRTNNLADELS